MATTFPLSTYPLDQRTAFDDQHTVERDIFDDGSMGLRVLGSATYRQIRCVFQPMSKTDAATFEAYLRTNRATEFDMALGLESPLVTYTGYIWSDINSTMQDGLVVISFTFRGEVT